ncbi:MAG: endonuclease/exonuclease/phosphatase family protein, partial [Ignavibacteriales bacterium]|nr:endonuclease/exonuclease/phosphatase family protein [Ignavibacteriales bacterium]
KLNMIGIFARAMYFSNGEYGNAILSKYTFLKTRNVLLPQIVGSEPRCAVEVVSVLSSGDTIAIISTHLDHSKDETDRIEQAKMLNKIFTANKYPTILAGDLNATPNSNPINILEEVWNSSYDQNNPEPTFPSNGPRVKIDYVMTYPNDKWKVIETKVIKDSIASDHCAYLVILKL